MGRWGIGAAGRTGLRRRREERRRLAAEQGWEFREEAPELVERWRDAVGVGGGAAPRARSVATGVLDGHRVTVFDWVTGRPEDGIRAVHLVELPGPLPLVAVSRHLLAVETLLPLLRRRVRETPGRHLYESGDAEYDAVHLVETTDPGTAGRLLTPAVREYADDRRWLEWRVDDRWLCLVDHGGPAAGNEEPLPVLRSLIRLVELADPDLWGEHRPTRTLATPTPTDGHDGTRDDVRDNVPEDVRDDDGPTTMHLGGPAHTGVHPQAPAPAGFRPWSVRLPGLPRAAPAVCAGTLYQTADRCCYALDALTGDLRWRHEAQDRLTGTPAVAGDSVHVIGQDGMLRALDTADGTERWSTRVGTSSSPTVADGVVYTVTTAVFSLRQKDSSRLVATDARTGRKRWEQYLPDGSCSEATVAGGTVYVTGLKGQLGAYRAEDGERVWYDDNAERFLATCTPSVAAGVVYIGTGAGLVHAFDAVTGKQRWGAEVGGSAIDHSPAIAGDLLLIGDFLTGVHALDVTDGMRRWYLAGPNGASSVTVSGADAWVVSAAGNRSLLRIDPATGAVRWRRGLDGPGSSPVYAEGVVYVTTAKGTILALDALTGRRPALRDRKRRIA